MKTRQVHEFSPGNCPFLGLCYNRINHDDIREGNFVELAREDINEGQERTAWFKCENTIENQHRMQSTRHSTLEVKAHPWPAR